MSEEDPSTIPEGKEEEGKESESEIKNEEQIAEEKEEVSSVFEFLPKELLLSLISPSSLSDSLPLDDIDKYIKRIDEEIVKTEEQLLQVYETNKSKFIAQFQSALDKQSQIDSIKTKIHDITEQLEHPETGIYPSALKQVEAHQIRIHHLRDAERNVDILNRIDKVDFELKHFQEKLDSGKFKLATESIYTMETTLGNAPVPTEPSTSTKLSETHQKMDKVKQNLCKNLETLWSKFIQFSNGQLTVTTKYVSEKQTVFLSEIVVCLQSLGIFQEKLRNFSENLLEKIIQPIIKQTNISTVMSIKEKEVESQGSHKSVIELISESSPMSKNVLEIYQIAGKVLESVQCVFHLVFVKIFSQHKEFMRHWRNSFWREMSDFLIDSVLKKAVPEDITKLSTYQIMVNYTESFETKLQEIGFLTVEDKELSTFVNNVDAHFADMKRVQVLTEGRKLLLNKEYKTVTIEENGQGLFQFPNNCKINITTQQLVDLAYKTLEEATNSSFRCGHKLYNTTRDLFDMFLSVVTVFHASKLESVTLIALMFSNDCMYIAYHLLTLAHKFKARLPPTLNETATFIDMVPAFRRLQYEFFSQQLAKEQKELLGALETAHGLGDTNTEERFNQVKQSFNKVLLQLTHLSKTWKDVLPLDLYEKSIGTLLESAVVKLIAEVESLRDISIEETEKLTQLLNELDSCSSLISAPNLHKYASHWTKFKKLIEILKFSMADIEERYNAGEYKDFTTQELHSLIFSLFSDNPKRKKLLQLIK